MKQNVPTQSLGALLMDLTGESVSEDAKAESVAPVGEAVEPKASFNAEAIDIAPGVAVATSAAAVKLKPQSLSVLAQPWRSALSYLAGNRPAEEPVEEVATEVATAKEVAVPAAIKLNIHAQPWKNLLAWVSGRGHEEEWVEMTTAPAPVETTSGNSLETLKTKWNSPATNSPGINIAGLIEEFLLSDGETSRS